MQVGRSQVDDYLFAGNMEALGLEGSHRSQEALFYGRIGQAHQVDAHPQGDIYFDGYRNGADSQAFGTVDINKHAQ